MKKDHRVELLQRRRVQHHQNRGVELRPVPVAGGALRDSSALEATKVDITFER